MARRRRSKPAGRQRKTPAPASKWQRLLSWRPLAVISLIIWALYFTTSWFVGGPTPLPLKIAIDRAGATTLSYKTTPVSLISPVCGCARDESTNWRGISFVTRRFEITRPQSKGTDGATYAIFAPFPGPFSYLPNQFRIKVSAYDVAIPSGASLAMRVGPEGPPDAGLEAGVRLSQSGEPSVFLLDSRGAATFETTGTLPIAAWMPLKDSTVELAAEGGPRNLATTTYSIAEKFGAAPKAATDQDGGTPTFEGGYPAADFIGPVIWAWAPALSEDRAPDGKDHYEVVRIEAPYAVRIVAQPVRFIKGSTFNYGARPAGGSVGLSFTKNEDDIAEYKSLQRKIAEAPVDIVKIPDLRFTTEDGKPLPGGETIMTMTAPPSPLSDGFNVYGDIDRLVMARVDGSVMSGANKWDVRNAQLSLSDLTKFVRNGIGSSLPVQMDGDAIRATAEFGAVGDVAINDVVVTTPARKWEQYRAQLELIALIAGLVTTFCALFGWAWSRYAPAGR